MSMHSTILLNEDTTDDASSLIAQSQAKFEPQSSSSHVPSLSTAKIYLFAISNV